MLEKAKQVEDAEAEVKRLEAELKPLPPDPDAARPQAPGEQERLALLAQHIAVLERLHQDRSELTKAAAAEKSARAEEGATDRRGEEGEGEFCRPGVENAGRAKERARADQAAAEARRWPGKPANWPTSSSRLTGEKTCRACGQPLTAKHFADEKKTRGLDAKAAEAKLKALTDAAAKARKHEEELDREGEPPNANTSPSSATITRTPPRR